MLWFCSFQLLATLISRENCQKKNLGEKLVKMLEMNYRTLSIKCYCVATFPNSVFFVYYISVQGLSEPPLHLKCVCLEEWRLWQVLLGWHSTSSSSDDIASAPVLIALLHTQKWKMVSNITVGQNHKEKVSFS